MASVASGTSNATRPHNVDVEEGWTTQVRAVRAYNRKLLFTTLDSIEGNKTIVWSEKLMQRVNVFATGTELKEHGVVANHIVDKQQTTSSPNILFFVEKSMTEANKLIDYLTKVNNANSYNHVFFIPDEWYAARQKLKDQKNIWEKLESVQALPLSWLPSEGDIISLGEPTLPSRLLLNGDWTVLHRCACALFELERMVGRPLVLHSKGRWSDDIANMMVKMRDNNDWTSCQGPQPLPPAVGLNLNRLVLIDRWVDPLAPLLTPHTYAAMLDDVYGIGLKDSVKIPESELDKTEKEKKDNSAGRESDKSPNAMRDIAVNDEIFHRLKHLHIAQLGREVADIWADVKRDSEKSKAQMSIAEYHLFVKKLPIFLYRKDRLTQHMHLNELLNKAMHRKYEEIMVERELLSSPISERVLSPVEDVIVRGECLHRSLRLVAIQSIAAEGLKTTVLHAYRKMIFQSFGVDALNKFVKMQKIGLIREKAAQKFLSRYSPMLFSQQKKEYNLMPEEVEAINPSNSAYAYAYYSSLVVRMIEEGVKIKWVGWNTPKGSVTLERNNGDMREEDAGATAVFVVGGITRAEVAGLRQIKNIGLIASSSIANRKSIIDSLTNIL
ncbi:hypothetical protein PMAYCL1PPCAC_12568 [Pristionchus mayeri]|uniref:Vps-33.1 n=1 Tax=Pristionchus mayeri TaxID=1317129 RepID=A0AAN4ZPL3_9BILA|nr:hypothetical protein PMAYCL1PPCAC_12568 [Pristionchus mayeri]